MERVRERAQNEGKDTLVETEAKVRGAAIRAAVERGGRELKAR